MPKGMVFWLIFIVCLLFGGWWCFGYGDHRAYAPEYFVTFVLIGILGWGIYGPAVK
jgi:hypothetical protein